MTPLNFQMLKSVRLITPNHQARNIKMLHGLAYSYQISTINLLREKQSHSHPNVMFLHLLSKLLPVLADHIAVWMNIINKSKNRSKISSHRTKLWIPLQKINLMGCKIQTMTLVKLMLLQLSKMQVFLMVKGRQRLMVSGKCQLKWPKLKMVAVILWRCCHSSKKMTCLKR